MQRIAALQNHENLAWINSPAPAAGKTYASPSRSATPRAPVNPPPSATPVHAPPILADFVTGNRAHEAAVALTLPS